MMHQSIEMKQYLIFFISFITCLTLQASTSKTGPLTLAQLDLPPHVIKNLPHTIFAKSLVKTQGKQQSLDLNIVGLHPKKCVIALSKISQLERYQEFISFVKRSDYNEKTQVINLLVSHLLMPYDMTLVFKIKRPTDLGDYPFTFQQGFLKGLKGLIRIGKHQKRCLFSMQASWQGPQTKISDGVFSFFLEFLGEKLMNRLFHISRTL